MIYLTSDEHFGHRNIIDYESRPFSDLLEMRNTLIANWNAVVTDTDIVYCLGDFSFLDKEKTTNIVKSLNGYKILIRGNHDRHNIQWFLDCGFNEVYPYRMVHYKNLKILLTHRPTSVPMEFQKAPDYDLHIYGHVHSKGNENGKYPTFAKNGACVCVERTDYTPINLDLIIEECAKSDNIFSEHPQN